MVLISLPPDLSDRFGGIGLSRQAKSNSEIKGSEPTPINIRLQQRDNFTSLPIKPRHYQLELAKKALEDNVIIYLGTGLGKTFIVVMVLKSTIIEEQIRRGRCVVFLAPTQDLVKQQAEYIYRNVPYTVKVYCGRSCNAGQHIDNWSKDVWDAELNNYQLLFMTPAILNQALAINALNWASIAMVVFDEVHHAATSKNERLGKKSGTHYSQILKHYSNMSSGRSLKFLGLTASLINNMPKDSDCIRNGIHDLERKLGAMCVTDLSAIESKPKHVIWTHNSAELTNSNDTIVRLFHDYAERYERALKIAEAHTMSIFGPRNDEEKGILAYHNRLKLASKGFSIKPSSFHKVLRQLAAIRKSSGIWTLANICYNLVKAMETHSKAEFVSPFVRPIYIEFGNILKKLLVAIYNLVGTDNTSLLLDYSQPKLLCLLDILKREYDRVLDKTGPKETFSSVVFVKSRIEVYAICSWLNMVSENIAGYEFIKADYAIGLSATMTSKWACITRRKSTEQSLILNDFRRGKLNIIVTTSVLEEGIDLPVCSTVIRYDTADTFRVYVQSRGRARQRDSSFIILSEQSKYENTKDALDKYNDFEERIKEVLKHRDQSRQQIENRPLTKNQAGDNLGCQEDYFKDQENGIFITAANARTILHMYCTRLARRCPYSDGLQFNRHRLDDSFQTTLYFPPGCPVKDSVQGGVKKTVELADSSAIIAAFEALYRAGELDSHGVPVRATQEHVDRILSKYGMEPDFSNLADHLEGEVSQNNDVIYHSYTWKICNLTSSSLSQQFTKKLYKLYRISFTANDDERVRRETRHYFENSSYGLIVDASQDHSNMPIKISSHYGEFKVSYHLIDDSLKLDSHQQHHSYFNYTFRLMKTFWNLPALRKESFSERCLFYLVPLDRSDDIDLGKLSNAFFMDSGALRPGDVVKINRFHSTKDNFSKKFIVHEVRYDMNAFSMIPNCHETFIDRLSRQEIRVRDVNQPVVSVWPISREFGRTAPGKRVRSDDSSQLNFYLWQCLERVICDPHEAYQAYNLPEIVYQLYVNALASDLESRFLEATASARVDVPERRERQSDIVGVQADSDDEPLHDSSVEGGDSGSCDQPLGIVSEDIAQDESCLDVETEFDESGSHASDSASDYESSDYDYDSSDSAEPAPSKKYLDILAKQEFNLQQRDKSGLEKWDMREYNVPDLKRQTVEHEHTNHYVKHVDTSSKSCSVLSLPYDTLEHQLKVEEILKSFQKGIIGDCELLDEEQNFDRRGCEVDLDIKAPLEFDRRTKPASVPLKVAFIEALTLRRASGDNNLEALENIGDTYFKYCMSVLLFKYIDENEGLMTSARSRLVGNKHFYHLAKKNKLGSYAILNKFDRDTLGVALGSTPVIKNRLRLKDMADMVESLVGACLVYAGEHEAIMAMKWLGFGHIFREDTFYEFNKHAVVFSKPDTKKENVDSVAELLKQRKKQLRRFQTIIKYKFNDESYLVQAFTHASAFTRCTDSYERLEFLGDAILDFLVTMTLYDAGYTKDPGQLTSSRSALVNNCTFAKLAIRYKYDIYIQHANQQLFDELNKINELVESDADLEFLDIVEFDRISKTLADVFEAVAGAIYLDSGCSLDTVYSIYYPVLKDVIDAEIRKPTANVVTRLYEMFPGKDRIKFEFYKTTHSGEEEDVVCAKCSIVGLTGEFFGEGFNKRQAKLRAVAKVMDNLPEAEEISLLNEQWNTLMVSKRATNNRGARGGRRRGSRGRRGDQGGRSSFRRF